MAKLPEVLRVVAIEHTGETLKLEVHIHLSQDEIRTILMPAVLDALALHMRQNGVKGVLANGTAGGVL